MATNDTYLRERLTKLLEGGESHQTFDQVTADFPIKHINLKPPHNPYSFWHLVEHIRFTQADILEYIQDPDNYSEKNWPLDYWPEQTKKATEKMWHHSLISFNQDLKTLIEIVNNPQNDLAAPLPNTPGHTILREIHIVSSHTSYHVGEFGILRQVTQTWPASHR